MGQKSISFQIAYKTFVLDAEIRRCTKSTLKFHRDKLVAFSKWIEPQGVVNLPDITKQHIRLYLQHLQSRELADHTLHGHMQVLKTFFRFCEAEEFIERSPMHKLAMPKIDKSVRDALSPGDVQRLLDQCQETRDAALVLVLFDTGLRLAELIALVGSDIDLNVGSIQVRKGKGGKQRTAYVGVKSRKALLRYYANRGEPAATERVWLALKGNTPFTCWGVILLLRRLGESIGKRVTAHMFRRGFAIEMLRSGSSIYHVAALMGHEEITTLRPYLKLVEQDGQAAHKQHGTVDRLIEQKRKGKKSE